MNNAIAFEATEERTFGTHTVTTYVDADRMVEVFRDDRLRHVRAADVEIGEQARCKPMKAGARYFMIALGKRVL